MENLQEQNINKTGSFNKKPLSTKIIPIFFLAILFLVLFWASKHGFYFSNVYSSFGILPIWVLIVFVLSIVSLVSKRKIIYKTINYICVFGTLLIILICATAIAHWGLI